MSFNPAFASQFLAKVLPWPKPDDNFWISIHPFFADKRLMGRGRAVKTIVEALDYVTYWTTRDNVDLYFCVAGLDRVEEKTDKRTGYSKTVAVRRAPHAAAMRTLAADVDVKKDAYASTDEALAALRAAIIGAGLPTPTAIVMSGSGGFHVYWSFHTPISQERWLALAHKLVAALQQHGLKFDEKVTSNPVQVLRVPGTTNWKGGRAKPVTLWALEPTHDVESIENVLKDYKSVSGRSLSRSAHSPLGLAPRANGAIATDEFSAGLRRRINELLPVCPTVLDAITTGGAKHQEPLWFMLAQIAYFCDDGRRMFHAMSDKHPDYDEDACNAKYDQVASYHVSNPSLGWPSCHSINGSGSQACKACPHRDEGKTPFHFRHQANGHAEGPTAVLDTEPMPNGFFLDNKRRLWRSLINKDGEPYDERITMFPIIDIEYRKQPYQLIIHSRIGDDQITAHLPNAEAATSERMRIALYSAGLVVPRRLMQHMEDFLVSFIEMLEENRSTYRTADNFGWVEEDGKYTAFVYNNTRYNCAGNIPAVMRTGTGDKDYKPRGDLTEWQKAGRLITDQDRFDLEALLATGFAAPLVAFTGHKGFTVNAWSSASGVHKTTAARTACAVWSNPTNTMQRTDDTENLVNKKLGMLNNLPLYYDEMQASIIDQRWMRSIMTMTSGKTKGRLTRSSDFADIETWATIIVATSNESLIDYAAETSRTSAAPMMRIVDWPIASPKNNTGMVKYTDAQDIIRGLDYNYGRAGEIYAAYLGSHIDQTVDDVRRVTQSLADRLNFVGEERYWVSCMAIIYLGALYANRLKLVEFNLDGILQFLIATLERLRTGRSSILDMDTVDSLCELVAEFVNSHKTQTIITDKMPKAKIGRPKELVTTYNAPTEIDRAQRLVVRLAKDDKRLLISRASFYDFLRKDKKLACNKINEALKRHLHAEQTRTSIGYATNWADKTMREHLLEFDLNDPACSGIS